MQSPVANGLLVPPRQPLRPITAAVSLIQTDDKLMARSPPGEMTLEGPNGRLRAHNLFPRISMSSPFVLSPLQRDLGELPPPRLLSPQ